MCSVVRCLLLACGLSLLQGTAHGDHRILWVGQSPCLIRVHEVDEASGSLVLRQAETNLEMAEHDVLRKTIDGKVETIKITEAREVRDRPKEVTFSLKNTKVYDRTGRLLGEVEVLKRVKPGMAVVLARRGDKIGLDYLFVFKKETLILVLQANQEVPMPEPLPRSVLIPVLVSVLNVCDDLISRGFRTVFALL